MKSKRKQAPKEVPVEASLHSVRRSNPALGRLRLGLTLLANWPNLLFAAVGTGSRVVRMGFLPPTLMLLLVLGAARFADDGPVPSAVCLHLGLALALFGSWAVFGVIFSVFTMPVSEGILSRIERLAEGIPCKIKNPSAICLSLADTAWSKGMRDDYMFFMDACRRVEALEEINSRRMKTLKRIMEHLRKGIARARELVANDCLVRHFSEILMVFLSTILSFALVVKADSALDPGGYEPKGPMTYFDSVYFSFTTVTTTDFGDILPTSKFSRFLIVWEQCFGVAFMTVVIGAACQLFQNQKDKDIYDSKPVMEKKLRRRIILFALRLFRNYDSLSKPRREIDALLDSVERRAEDSGLKVMRAKPLHKERYFNRLQEKLLGRNALMAVGESARRTRPKEDAEPE